MLPKKKSHPGGIGATGSAMARSFHPTEIIKKKLTHDFLKTRLTGVVITGEGVRDINGRVRETYSCRISEIDNGTSFYIVRRKFEVDTPCSDPENVFRDERSARFCADSLIDDDSLGDATTKDQQSTADDNSGVPPPARKDRKRNAAHDGGIEAVRKRTGAGSNEQRRPPDALNVSQPQIIKKEETDEEEDIIECMGVVQAPSRALILESGCAGSSRNTVRRESLRKSDVVRVHGETALEHHGNAEWQRIININKSMFANAKSPEEQSQISKCIVASIREDAHGRFLERDTNDKGIITSLENVLWKELSEIQAVEMTLSALRMDESSASPLSPHPTTRKVVAPAATPATKEGKSPVDPTSLIKLHPQQCLKMKFPIGCPIWYNIHCVESQSEMSTTRPLLVGNATIGIVRSIAMDISTGSPTLVYGVSPEIPGHEEARHNSAEGELAYAAKCPITICIGDEEPLEGEVIAGGWGHGEAAKKSYTVAMFLKRSGRIRIFQVNEDSIAYRPAAVNAEKSPCAQER